MQDPDFAGCPREVETLIEMPIAVLRDPARLRWQRRQRQGDDGTGVTLRVPYFALGEPDAEGGHQSQHGHDSRRVRRAAGSGVRPGTGAGLPG